MAQISTLGSLRGRMGSRDCMSFWKAAVSSLGMAAYTQCICVSAHSPWMTGREFLLTLKSKISTAELRWSSQLCRWEGEGDCLQSASAQQAQCPCWCSPVVEGLFPSSFDLRTTAKQPTLRPKNNIMLVWGCFGGVLDRGTGGRLASSPPGY